MDSLPLEMIEHILKFVDGHTLIKSKAVCQKWSDVAALFDEDQPHWKSLCFKEISRIVLLELTIKRYPYWRPSNKNVDQLNWKVLYLTWLQWKVLNNFLYHIDVVLEQKPCYVTCLKIIEDSIVVGLHSGEIKSWKTSGGDPFLIARHRSRVTCLEVLCVLDERKEAKADKRLNYILSTSHDRMVKISYLIEESMEPKVFDICHHEHATIMIRVQQSYFATLDESGAIAVFVVSAPQLHGIMPVINFIVLYHPCKPPVVSLDLWGTKVTAMTKKGTIMTADFAEGQDAMEEVCSLENDTVQVTVVADASTYFSKVNHYQSLEISQYYNWRNNIFMWITEGHKMLISLNGYEYYEYNVEEMLKTHPRSALIYGNMLILGMNSGSVVMYYFGTPEDLLRLDLLNYHWLHPVAKKPVLGMDIWERPSGPLLAVLSHSNVHLVEWPFDLDDVIYGE